MSLRDWFLTPAPTERRSPPEAHESTPPARDAGTPPDSTAAWAPPIHAAPAAPAHAAPAHAAPAHTAPAHTAPAHTAPAHAAPVHAAHAFASAAVIGRAGEAEPIAAGIALALRGRAAAAAVVIIAEHAAPNGEGGTRAARRLAARLDAHGFAVAARGRLAWVYAEPDEARRAVRVAGEPVVLAITLPLDAALELAIGDTDLAVVVARDARGPLAQMATASLAGHDVSIATPLPRGLPRLLARCGLRAPAELRNSLRT